MSKRACAGSRWESFKRLVLATYGDVCWICGHGGARTVDHVESQTDRPDLVLELSNCRPSHGTWNKCPVCGQHCNQLRGGYSVERARRIIAERSPPQLKKPKTPPGQAGREW